MVINRILSAPEDALYVRSMMNKARVCRNCAGANYIAPKFFGLAAIILSTFNCPLYLLKGVGTFTQKFSELKFREAIVELGKNFAKALHSLFIAVVLTALLAITILIPCAFRVLPQQKIQKSPIDESIEQLTQQVLTLKADNEKLNSQLPKDLTDADVLEAQEEEEMGSEPGESAEGRKSTLEPNDEMIDALNLDGVAKAIVVRVHKRNAQLEEECAGLQATIEQLKKEALKQKEAAPPPPTQKAGAPQGKQDVQIAVLQAKLQKLTEQSQTSPAASEKIAQLETALEVQKMLNGDKDQALAKLQKEFEAYKQDPTGATKKLQDELESLRALKDQAMSEKADIEQEKNQLKRRIPGLTGDLEKARANVKYYKGEHEKAMAELSKYKPPAAQNTAQPAAT